MKPKATLNAILQTTLNGSLQYTNDVDRPNFIQFLQKRVIQ